MAKKKLQAMNGDVAISDINPAINSKYSKNLYHFLKRSEGVFHKIQAYLDKDGVIYLGWIDDNDSDGAVWFTGARLMAVLCFGTRERIWAFAPGLVNKMKLRHLPDFWTKYKAVGRCAIDTNHEMWFVDDDSRWDPVHPGVCQWCGKFVLKHAG